MPQHVCGGEKGARIDGRAVGEPVVLMHHSRFGRTVSGIEFKSSGGAIDALMSSPEPRTSSPSHRSEVELVM